MREIKITTQDQLDALLEVSKDQTVIIESSETLKLKIKLSVFGILKINCKVDCSRWQDRFFVAWENSSVEAWGNSSVVARGNSSVVARGNSSVVARGNSSVVAWENSSVEARGNSSVVAWENSSVEARGNSSVEAWENSSVVAWENSSVEARGNSSVEAWGNSSVVARGNSSVVAWENSSVVAWENSSVEARGNSSVVARENSSVKTIKGYFSGLIKLFGFSVAWKHKSEKLRIEKNGDHCIVQEFTDLPYLEREGVPVKDGKVILYKRVSSDYKTQENTKNETLWAVGTTVTHPKWTPTNSECGEGKFHACSRPYFCDEFRSTKGDRYVAIQVEEKELFEWTSNPSYPHKIAFRECVVLFDCDRFGKEIKA